MMGNILIYEEYTQLYPGGTVTRDLFGVAHGGGVDRGVPESAQN